MCDDVAARCDGEIQRDLAGRLKAPFSLSSRAFTSFTVVLGVLSGVRKLRSLITCDTLDCTTFTFIDRGRRNVRFPPHFRNPDADLIINIDR